MLERSDIIMATETVADPDDIRAVIRRRVDQLFSSHLEVPAGGVRVVRLAMPVDRIDPFVWLGAQQAWPRIYWAGRGEDEQTAAAGTADLCGGDALADYDTLRLQLDRIFAHSDNDVRYFGGFRFDRFAETATEWRPFGTYQFVLPRFELGLRGDEAVLACNVVLPHDRQHRDALFAEIERLRFPSTTRDEPFPEPLARVDVPDHAAWCANVERALALFASSPLEKVVLARRATFRFEAALDPLALLGRLRAATPNCFHFCFQPDSRRAFVGATPERLFRRDGRTIRSEAVAGTRPRGTTPEDDAALSRELLASEKDRREHQYVRLSMCEALAPLTTAVSIDDVSEMVLAGGRHLYSGVEAILDDHVVGSDVMEALHPTPAVGGYPTGPALDVIRDIEPFDRGWYAGPVGWIGTRGAAFAVAIRSGLVDGRDLSLYSGAGIVEGSQPEAEWREIEQKISDFVKVLGLDVR